MNQYFNDKSSLFYTKVSFDTSEENQLLYFQDDYFFICIFHDYMGHDSNKEFWKNTHFENMTAGFLLRYQNLLRYFTPEMTYFQA